MAVIIVGPNAADREWTFTFAWRIENFSHCLQKKGEILYSPLFAVEALDNSDWSLCLYPRGRHSGSKEIFGLHLRREKAGPFSLLAEYELSIFTFDSSEPVVEYAMSLSFLKNSSGPFHGLPKHNEMSLENKNTFLEQEVLIVRCRLRPFNPERSFFEPMLQDSAMQTKAVSRIAVDRGLRVLTIEDFSKLGLEEIRNTRLTVAMLRESFTLQASLQGRSKQDSSLYLRIIQDVINYRRLLLLCKVSLLDQFGRVAKVVEDKNWFETSRKTVWTFANFITRREILEGRNNYLSGDVLTFHCEFSISAGVEFEKIDKPWAVLASVPKKPKNNVPTPRTPLSTLQDDLRSLYKERTLTDFELRADGASFPVHKIILSARSPVFKAMFDSNMIESSASFLHIPDLDGETLGRILLFIYTSTIDPLTWDSAAKLYYAADKYQIPSLKQKCASFMKRNLRFPNVCEALVIADRHQDEELKSDVHGFLLQYMKKIIILDEWKAFMAQHVELAAETMHLILLKRDVVDKKSTRMTI